RSAMASAVYPPSLSAFLFPIPPCIRQRPFGIAGARHDSRPLPIQRLALRRDQHVPGGPHGVRSAIGPVSRDSEAVTRPVGRTTPCKAIFSPEANRLLTGCRLFACVKPEISRRSAMASAVYPPSLSAFLFPIPPCIRQRPFGIAGARHDSPFCDGSIQRWRFESSGPDHLVKPSLTPRQTN